MSEKEHYVRNKDLYPAMVKYRQSVLQAEQDGKPKPRVPEYIGACILKIAERLATKHKYRYYSYTDEMIMDGVTACIRYIDNYDPDRYDNPFAYFSSIINNAFINRLNLEQKNQYVRARLMRDVTEVGVSDNLDSEFADSDGSTNVIEAFERRMADRKMKAAEKKKKDTDE